MASDTLGSSVKTSGVGSGRLPRAGTPLVSKAITSSPRHRLTPRGRRYGLPPNHESDASLSDHEQPEQEADSEAETERLHLSPQKVRPKMTVQHPDPSTTTTTTLPVDMSPSRPVIVRTDELVEDPTRSPTPRNAANKKRKREEIDPPSARAASEESEKPVAVHPPKKKVHASSSQKRVVDTDDDEHSPQPNGDGDTPLDPEANGTKATHDDAIAHEESNEDAEPPQNAADGDEEPAEESAAPVDEDLGDVNQEDEEKAERKKQAAEDLVEIETIFAKLKDKVYDDKLRRVQFELKLLEEGTHPEYVAQKAVIDERLAEKRRLADAKFAYEMQALDTATRVTKAQIHSQYFQTIRKIRENKLYQCSELWYHIQRERRAADALVPEYTYRIADRKSARTLQRTRYNWEVAMLSGLQRDVGFPAAPDIKGASEDEMLEDFEALGITPTPRPVARPPAPSSTLGRLDERPSPYGWAQPSPPSPGHPAAVASTHPHSHVHRHIHHHHNKHIHPSSGIQRQGQTDPSPSRTSGMSSVGPQPPTVSLSSLLQQSEGGSMRMDSYAPPSSLQSRNESYSTYGAGPSSRPLSSLGQYGRPAAEHGPHDMETGRRIGDHTTMAEALEASVNPPISHRHAHRGYA